MSSKGPVDELVKSIRGLALAASRARDLAEQTGKDSLGQLLSRHQADALRQQLLDATQAIERIQKQLRT